MGQSGVVFGALIVAFLVFITMNGHLLQYLQLLGVKQGTSSTTTTPANATTALTSIVNPATLQPLTAINPTTALTPVAGSAVYSPTSTAFGIY